MKKNRLPFIPKERPYLMIPADCGYCTHAHYAAEDLGPEYRGVVYCDYLKEHILGFQYCAGFHVEPDMLMTSEYIVEVNSEFMSEIHPYDVVADNNGGDE